MIEFVVLFMAAVYFVLYLVGRSLYFETDGYGNEYVAYPWWAVRFYLAILPLAYLDEKLTGVSTHLDLP